MSTVTMQESEAPCFPHETLVAPSPQSISPQSRSPRPGRRNNGDGKGIQVDIGARLREYVDCLNNSKWEAMENHLADTLQRNGHPQTREEHIARLRSRVEGLAGFEIKIDTMLVDRRARAVAARYINRLTVAEPMMYVDAVGKTFEFDEQCFVWFDGRGKVSRIVTLQDNDGVRAQNPAAATTPRFLTRGLPEEPVDLRSLYRAYVASINHGTMASEFPRFCARQVRHNGRALPVEDYWRSIELSQEAIAGLSFEIQELLVDEETQQVAARLEITGTPIAEFADARPNGKSVRFHEHCMYRFDKGKISLVWATMELDTYRRQLEPKTDRRKSSMLGIN